MSKKKRFGVSSSLSRSFIETVNIVEHNTGVLRNAVIPLSRIEIDPDNPRKLAITVDDVRNGLQKNDPSLQKKTEELNKLQEVAHTIQSNGMLNPITVYKYGNDYRIVAGERRYLASILAGLSEIDARVYNNRPQGFALKLVQWIENTAREDLNLRDKINNINDMAIAYRQQYPAEQISATWLHNITGLSLPQATYYITVLNAPEDIKTAIQEGHINSLDKAYTITTIKQADLRAKAIQACTSGLSFKELKKIAKETQILHKKKDRVINLGKTKSVNVIKSIINAVLALPEHKELQSTFDMDKWENLKEAEISFKKFINILENKLDYEN
jgi:ParB family transcriptional regulator, chromosome partitioning protein